MGTTMENAAARLILPGILSPEEASQIAVDRYRLRKTANHLLGQDRLLQDSSVYHLHRTSYATEREHNCRSRRFGCLFISAKVRTRDDEPPYP